MARRRSHRPWLVGACVAGVAATLGIGLAQPFDLHGSNRSASAATAMPSLAPPRPVLAAAAAGAPVPSAQSVAAAVGPALAAPALGGHFTAQIIDVATGTALYAKDPAGPTTPASTMKLATAIAVLATRGPAYQIPTRVVAGQHPGEVVLIGAGDPTLAATTTPFYPGAASLPELAAQVRAALGPVKPTKVVVDSSLFSGAQTAYGWLPEDVSSGENVHVTALITDGGRVNPTQQQRFPQPDLGAGQAFAHLLGLPGTAVTRGLAPPAPAGEGTSVRPTRPVRGPAGAPAPRQAGVPLVRPGAQLGEVESPPIQSILDTTLSNSDNVLAEYLARQVALARHLPATFAGACAAVLATLRDMRLPIKGVVIVDGSGLSHWDRLTPELLTGILAYAASPRRPLLHALFSGLPVAGFSGTLIRRFTAPLPGSDPAAGVARAKTGTLLGVHCLAGIVVDADGRLLAFAMLADGVPIGGGAAANDQFDRAVSALAGLRR